MCRLSFQMKHKIVFEACRFGRVVGVQTLLPDSAGNEAEWRTEHAVQIFTEKKQECFALHCVSGRIVRINCNNEFVRTKFSASTLFDRGTKYTLD